MVDSLRGQKRVYYKVATTKGRRIDIARDVRPTKRDGI